MKNLQKFAVALLVGIMAIGFSAFKNASNKLVPSWVYVQQANNSYQKIAFSSYNSSLCADESERPCAFIQAEGDTADHGTTLTYDAAEAISTLSPTAAEGLYNQ